MGECESPESLSGRGQRVQGRGETVEQVDAALAKAPTILDAEGDERETTRVSVTKPTALLDGRTLVSRAGADSGAKNSRGCGSKVSTAAGKATRRATVRSSASNA